MRSERLQGRGKLVDFQLFYIFRASISKDPDHVLVNYFSFLAARIPSWTSHGRGGAIGALLHQREQSHVRCGRLNQ